MTTPTQTPNLPALGEARIIACQNGREIIVAGTTLRYQVTPGSVPEFFNQQTEARAAKLLEVLVSAFGGAVDAEKGGAN